MTLLKSKIQCIYHPTKEDTWTGVNWSKVEHNVEKLQHRITRAAQRGQYRKVRDLQRLLTKNSLSASLKAVRVVAHKNSGKKPLATPGQLWSTTESKLQSALELCTQSDVNPLKKVSIAKHNRSQRCLGIACMSYSAHQALWNSALLPAVEATNDPHSYGFRPYRDCWEANAQIRTLLTKTNSSQWVLDADIEKGDSLMHYDWLLKNTPMEKKVLEKWLKAAYFETNNSELPQQSPLQGVEYKTLANLTLNGLENYLTTQFKPEKICCEKHYTFATAKTCINVVRYVDALVVTGRSKRQLEHVKNAINEFLKPRGLRINEEKTNIEHISKGFDFLGWNFRKYPNGKLLCKISKKSIIEQRKEIKYLTKTIHDPERLISKLNVKIRGWMKYHQCANGIWDVWGSMNKYLYERLIKWGLRRHSNKTKKWVFNKYWKHIDGRWTFTVTSKQGRVYELMSYNFRQKQNTGCNNSNNKGI